MYKQPSVPPLRPGDKVFDYLQSFILFIRGFVYDVWKSDSDMNTDIEDIKRRLDALEGK